MNFLELNQGTQSWIDWPFPATIPFILFACLLGWEFLLLLSKSAKLAVIFGPYSTFFFKSQSNWNTVESRFITIHGSSAGESSSRCALQRCGDPPVPAFIRTQLGLSFIICASTCHLPPRFSLQEKPPQVQFSLCTACVFQQNIQSLPAGRPPGSWLLIGQDSYFPVYDLAAHP